MPNPRTAKIALGLLAALATTMQTPAVASAADSMWLVCTGVMNPGGNKTYVAASLLEHRAADGAHRDLDVTLLKGAHAWRARILGAKAGDVSRKHVALHVVQGKRTIFAGTARLVLGAKKTFRLRGKMDLHFGAGRASLVRAKATLQCRQLDDLAIGHTGRP